MSSGRESTDLRVETLVMDCKTSEEPARRQCWKTTFCITSTHTGHTGIHLVCFIPAVLYLVDRLTCNQDLHNSPLSLGYKTAMRMTMLIPAVSPTDLLLYQEPCETWEVKYPSGIFLYPLIFISFCFFSPVKESTSP